ncbi:MAG: tetratricopeptide repeat protein [Bacteroidales bacterium]|nr:tetratricopeptide repeat protein [Bacteroidales bacterium]
MEDKKNIIKLSGDNNIVIQDVKNGNITINQNDEKLIDKLQKLNEQQLSVLQQMVKEQTNSFTAAFKTIITGIATQKNIVQNSNITAKNVRVGDNTEIHYHYHYENENNLPKHLTNFVPMISENEIVGRKNILDELHKLLFNEKPVVVVNGLGGIGKTTLAQAFIGKNRNQYRHIAWITQAEKNEDIFAVFAAASNLRKNLKIDVNISEPNEVFEEIIRKLNHIGDKPNLLVIDNANNSVEKIRNYLPDADKWHTLITSRNQLNGYTIKTLDFLSDEDAFTLFKKHYTKQNLTDLQIRELIKSLDYHTLSIEILAKTANIIEYDFEDLQNALQENIDTELTDVPHSGNKKIEKVSQYLCEIFKLSNLTEEELFILKNFACLPSDYIEYETLKELIIEDKGFKKFPLILKNICKKGWLLKDEKTETYKIHLIISDVVRKQAEIKFDEISYPVKTITEKLYLDQTKDNPVDKFQWAVFGKSIIKTTISNPPTLAKHKTTFSALYNNLALVLKSLGDYVGAKKLLEKALISDEKNFGTKHPKTAVRYSNLALVLKDLGDYKGAKKLLEKALISDEKTFGTEHPTTTVRYSNLALVLRDLGDYEGAKKLSKKALISDEKNFGKEHPKTAVRYSNFALVLKDLGDYEGAKKLLEKALISNEKNFGTEHPKTAINYSNLVTVLKYLGDYEGAKELSEKALISDEKKFGTEHPNTALRYSNLGTVLNYLGDYVGAKKLLEKALISNEKNFGTEHPRTAASYSNLGAVLQSLGDYEGAKKFLGKALVSDEKNFGTEHPRTAVHYTNLANLNIELNEIRNAIKLWEKSYIIFSKKLGENHPNTQMVIKALNKYKN